MLVLEAELKGKTQQFKALDEALRMAQYARLRRPSAVTSITGSSALVACCFL
jgi:hypothetical protein